MLISGAINHTRHQARASSRVLPEKVCSSGELSVTTQPAWSTSHQQEPRRVAIAAYNASWSARRSNVGSTPAYATVPARSGARTGRAADLLINAARFTRRPPRLPRRRHWFPLQSSARNVLDALRGWLDLEPDVPPIRAFAGAG